MKFSLIFCRHYSKYGCNFLDFNLFKTLRSLNEKKNKSNIFLIYLCQSPGISHMPILINFIF